MATATSDLFAASYAAFEQYPQGRINGSLAGGASEEYNKRLDEAEANNYQLLQRPEGVGPRQSSMHLYTPPESRTDVVFWQWDSPTAAIPPTRATNDDDLRKCLEDNKVTTPRGTNGSIASKDSKCRFIFLNLDNSTAPLLITRKSLQRLFTYHQVMPEFLDFLGVFGRRERTKDHVCNNLRHESYLINPPAKLCIPALDRSGCGFQLCYELRAAEGQSSTSWSIRPAAIHHQFDIVKGTSLWLLAQARLEIYKKIRAMAGPTGHEDVRNVTTPADCFRTSLATHLTNAYWAKDGWRRYISHLGQEVHKQTTLALHNSREKSDSRHEFTSDEVRLIHLVEEDLKTATIVLQGNIRNLQSLSEFYTNLLKIGQFPLRKACRGDILAFASELASIIKDLEMQIQRAMYYQGAATDRKALIVQYMQVQQNEISTDLQADTRHIALQSQRESVGVSIITILTLLFLPASFVSVSFVLLSYAKIALLSTNEETFMSSNVANWGNGDTNHPKMIQWIEITVPLTLGTLLIAAIIFFIRYDPKTKRLLPRWTIETRGGKAGAM